MSTIQPYSASSTSVPRRVARSLAAIHDQGLVKLGEVQQQALVQTAKADAVAYVGRSAMLHVAMLSQAEQELAQLVPLAASRLQGIADTVTLTLAEVVVDTATRMRAL
jgi:stage V sporulation protein SpoVS